jgi:hypothetical protein
MHNLSIFKSIFWTICLFAGELFAQSPLTVRQVFDFNVGDEFHYNTSGYGNFMAYGSYRLYVLNKTISVNNDTITYRFHINKLNQILSQSGQIIDTLYQTQLLDVSYYDLDSSIILQNFYTDASYNSYLNRYNQLASIDSSCLNALSFFDSLENWQLDNINHNSYRCSITEQFNTCNFNSYYSIGIRFAEGIGIVSKGRTQGGSYSSGSSEVMFFYRKGNVSVGTPNNLLVPVDLAEYENLKIFPNPADNSIFIKADESLTGSKFQIFNYAGLEVHFDRISGETTQIDITDLPSGLYYVKFEAYNKGNMKFLKK